MTSEALKLSSGTLPDMVPAISGLRTPLPGRLGIGDMWSIWVNFGYLST